MGMTVEALAKVLQLEFEGEGSFEILQTCGLEGQIEQGVSYIEHPKFVEQALNTPMKVFICKPDQELKGKIRIFAPNPGMALIHATNALHPPQKPATGIHTSVVQGEGCHIGKDVHLGPNVVLGNDVVIGDRTVIMAGTYIGDRVTIGDDGWIFPNVTIREDTEIGHRVFINPAAVIGSEGFGFLPLANENLKIPQIGKVVIEDDVEIGASNTIDRARFGVTRIGYGTKFDNQVHIAHNVEIGPLSLLAGASGSAGSTKAGRRLMMGGQAMLSGHLTVGDNVTISANSMLARNVSEPGQYSGIPARPHKEWLRANGWLYRLQEVFEMMKALKKKFPELSEK